MYTIAAISYAKSSLAYFFWVLLLTHLEWFQEEEQEDEENEEEAEAEEDEDEDEDEEGEDKTSHIRRMYDVYLTGLLLKVFQRKLDDTHL